MPLAHVKGFFRTEKDRSDREQVPRDQLRCVHRCLLLRGVPRAPGEDCPSMPGISPPDPFRKSYRIGKEQGKIFNFLIFAGIFSRRDPLPGQASLRFAGSLRSARVVSLRFTENLTEKFPNAPFIRRHGVGCGGDGTTYDDVVGAQPPSRRRGS